MIFPPRTTISAPGAVDHCPGCSRLELIGELGDPEADRSGLRGPPIRIVSMKATAALAATVLFLLLSPTDGWACTYDTDCAPGSRCDKRLGAAQGVCASGLLPGSASRTVNPVTPPLGMGLNPPAGSALPDFDRRVQGLKAPPGADSETPVRSEAERCSFDMQCGQGSRCEKALGALFGVCVR